MVAEPHGLDPPINRLRIQSIFRFEPPFTPILDLPNIRPRGEAWLQQDHSDPLCHRPLQGLACRLRNWRTLPCWFPLNLPLGRRSFRPMAYGFHVSLHDAIIILSKLTLRPIQADVPDVDGRVVPHGHSAIIQQAVPFA